MGIQGIEGACTHCYAAGEMAENVDPTVITSAERFLATNKCQFIKDGRCVLTDFLVKRAKPSFYEASAITDDRELIQVYIALARSNLQKRYEATYPSMPENDVKALVDSHFYNEAYDALLADEGGKRRTENAITEMVGEHRQGK